MPATDARLSSRAIVRFDLNELSVDSKPIRQEHCGSNSAASGMAAVSEF